MKWEPIAELPESARDWPSDLYRTGLADWKRMREKLQDPTADRTALDLWTTERNRLMAIETGQIEDLYTMRRGFTEQLITEGLEHVRASHTVEGALEDETLRGLLTDQHQALEMVFRAVNERPLSESVIKEWHALLTRHQEHAPGRDTHGRRIGILFIRGGYKRRPNNPRRPDGVIHEYCPPEHTASEMQRLLAMHHEHEAGNPFPTPVEAAWLHHRFVQIHPFEDGNGRTARLLMSHVYAKRGEPPPIVTATEKPQYIRALEAADDGDLRRFCTLLELKNIQGFHEATDLGNKSLKAAGRFHHMNGDISVQNGPKDWTHHRAEGSPEFGTPADPGNPPTRSARRAGEEKTQGKTLARSSGRSQGRG